MPRLGESVESLVTAWAELPTLVGPFAEAVGWAVDDTEYRRWAWRNGLLVCLDILGTLRHRTATARPASDRDWQEMRAAVKRDAVRVAYRTAAGVFAVQDRQHSHYDAVLRILHEPRGLTLSD
jgi:hypothetical protein